MQIFVCSVNFVLLHCREGGRGAGEGNGEGRDRVVGDFETDTYAHDAQTIATHRSVRMRYTRACTPRRGRRSRRRQWRRSGSCVLNVRVCLYCSVTFSSAPPPPPQYSMYLLYCTCMHTCIHVYVCMGEGVHFQKLNA